MKNTTKLAIAFFATAILTFAGCGGGGDASTAPVSGKVTWDGKPVDGIRLIFTPVPRKDNSNPGPWSTAMTNAQGEYTLETRYQKKGASVGQHTVAFEVEDAEDMEGLQEDMGEAKGEDGSQEQIAAVQKRMDDFKARQAGKPQVAEDYTVMFEVPAGGTTKADFDLPK